MRNRGFVFRERIEATDAGTLLIDYLSRRWSHSSAKEWRGRIAACRVTVDGFPADPATALAAGQLLCWHRPGWEEPAAPTDFAVLHRDAALLAVAKPAGLPVLPGAGFLESTLLSRVRSLHPEASPLHRLGRFTSGLVLFGRTPRARSSVQDAWRAGEVRRRYRALASGTPSRDFLAVRIRIGPVGHPRLGTVQAACPRGRHAASDVRVLERRGGHYLAEVEIFTGRTHQVRIHLAAAGTPLVGDPLYGTGGLPLPDPGLPGDPGYHLHSAELELRHPDDGSWLRLSCGAPPVLRVGFRSASPARR